MTLLAFSSFRTRWLSFIGVCMAVATGVAVTVACGFLLEAGIRGGPAPERLAGVDIVVAKQQRVNNHGENRDGGTYSASAVERRRIDAGVLEAVRQIPGVANAFAEVSFRAHVVGNDGQPINGPDGTPSHGHGWSSAEATPFDLVEGRRPTASGEVVVDEQLAMRAGIGAHEIVDVVTGGVRNEVTVVGIVRSESPLRHQAAIFFTDSDAATLYGHPGEADLVGAFVAGGWVTEEVADEVRDALGPEMTVLTGDDRGRSEALDGASAGSTLIAISAVLGGISTFVAMFVVAAMLSYLVAQRRTEIALLRAIAATPRQVRRLIRIETLLVTMLGGIAGLAPGLLLGRMIIAVWRSHGILPDNFESDHDHLPMAVALTLALVIGQGSASIAAHRASRVHPTEALRDSVLEPRLLSKTRALLGMLIATATAMLLLVCINAADSVGASVVAPLATSMLVVVALFAPVLSNAGVRVVGLAARPFGPAGYLATVNGRAYAARIAVVVMPIVLLVTVAAMSLLQQATLTHELRRQGSDRLLADTVITSGPTGLPPNVVAEVDALPEVDTAIGLLPTTIYAGPYLVSYPAQAISPGSIEAVLDLGVTTGSLSRLTPDDVALSDTLADELDAEVGESVEFRLGDGTLVERRVTAIYRRDRGFGDVLLAWEGVVANVSEPLLRTVLIRSGSAPPSSHASLERLIAHYPGTTLGGPENYRAVAQAEADARAWIGYMLFGMVSVFTAITVINTIVMTTAARTREFALLRLLGTTPRQLARMMRWEVAMSVAIGVVLGAAIGIATLAPFSIDVTGTWVPHIAVRTSVAVVSAVAGLVWISTAIPTRLALRTSPMNAI